MQSQLDYVYFIYGLSFLVVAVSSAPLYQRGVLQLSWGWLGIFALLHGSKEWLDLVALSAGDSIRFATFRVAAMAVSFACLLEFGRSSVRNLSGRGPSRWIVYLLLCAAGAGSLLGSDGFNAVVRYCLALPGALWAAAALWMAARGEGGRNKPLAASACFMALYGLLAGLVPPDATFFPASVLNQDVFLAVSGIPVQLVRAMVACGVAIGLAGYWNARSKRGVRGVSLRSNPALAAMVLLGVLMACGWATVNWLGHREDVRLRQAILERAQEFALALGPAELSSLTASAGTPEESNYEYTKTRLQILLESAPGARQACLLRRDKGRIQLLASTEGGDPAPRPVSSPTYVAVSESLKAIFSKPTAVVEGIMAGHPCVWFSARASESDVATVLEMDCSAGGLQRNVAAERLKGIGLTMLLLMAVLAGWTLRQRLAAAFHPAASHTRVDRLLQWGLPMMVALAGVTLTLSIFFDARRNERFSLESTFRHQSATRVSALMNAFEQQVTRLDGLCHYFESDELVDRSEFQYYTEQVLAATRAIRAVQWIPRVTASQRAQYERAIRQEGFPDFRIRERNGNGAFVPVGNRSEYFPVYYTAPAETSDTIVGFDVASHPACRVALSEARDEGQPTATEPLGSPGHNTSGFQIFCPVYSPGEPPRDATERRSRLRGFVVGTYNANKLLKQALRKLPPIAITLTVVDLKARSRPVVSCWSCSGGGSESACTARSPDYEQVLEVANRCWRVTAVASRSYVAEHSSHWSWWILAAGLVMSVLLGVLADRVLSGRLRAERLVAEQTRDSRETAQRVQRHNEILARVAVSEAVALGDVEKLAREMTASVAEAFGIERIGVWMFDEDGAHLACIDLYEASKERHSSGAVLEVAQFQREFDHLTGAKYVDAHDPLTDPRTAGYVEGYLKPLGITSMLDAVIRARGKNLGTLCFEYVNRPHRWQQDEIAFACQLADQIGMAIMNRETRRAGERLRASELFLRETQHIARLGGWKANPHTDHIEWSDGVYEILEVPRGIPLPLSATAKHFRPEDFPRIQSALLECLETGSFPSQEVEMTTETGRRFWGELRGFACVVEGERKYVMGTLQDISERKQAEMAVRKAQEELESYAHVLESANQALEESNQLANTASRAKSEFLANMSHEIRTPMTAILGYAEVMLESDIDPETREQVNVIQRNGEHLLGLINDILDLSKVEAGRLELQRVRCSPVELLSEVVSLMRVRAEAKHLQLVAEVAGELPETILTAPLRLRQVLVNLVGNAIKFTDRGEVRLVTRLLRDGGPPRLQVDVIDSGIGMNEAQIKMLFQPFVQVDSSASRKFGGTGLGLAISKRLMEAMGGTLEVQSTPSKGSLFRVTLPCGPLDDARMIRAQEVSARVSSVAAPSATRVDARVLLAEDGADNQRLISYVLKSAGADVAIVETGQAALELALAEEEAGRAFDVILMDMQMPVLDGYNATLGLRARGYSGPILALTAHAMADDHQKCLDAGCDDYLTKPIDRPRLIATVAEWAARKACRPGGDPAASDRATPAGSRRLES